MNVKVASLKPLLRHETDNFLVGQPANSISGSKSPTARAALRCFFHIKDQCLDRYVAFKKTVDNVLLFWAMARIPTLHQRTRE